MEKTLKNRSKSPEVDLRVKVLEAGEAPDYLKVGSEQRTGFQIHAVTEADGELWKIGYDFGRALDHPRLHEENVHHSPFVAGHFPERPYPRVVKTLARCGRNTAQRSNAIVAN